MNIYDTANQLERDIRKTDAFVALKEIHAEVEKNEEAKQLYTEFRKMQESLHQKMTSGEMPDEEEQQAIQEFSAKFQQNELLAKLLQTEQAFSQMIDDINRIIMKPVHEIYQN